MELGGRFILPQWSVGLVQRELKTELDRKWNWELGLFLRTGFANQMNLDQSFVAGALCFAPLSGDIMPSAHGKICQ